MISIHTALQRTALSIAVATCLVACGDENNSSNNYSDQEVNIEITVSEGHSQQDLPVAPEDEVKIATYAMSHDLSYSDKLVNDYMVEGNIINLPNTNYQVGDTVEFEDTIIKIDSIVDNGKYAIVPAGLFDVFSELEINTSMVMGSEEDQQVGVVGAPFDLLNSSKNIRKKYKDLEGRGCLPEYRSDITAHGVSNIHKSLNRSNFNGVQIALKGCKLLEGEIEGQKYEIITDQSINVGMVGKLRISKEERLVQFEVDGATLLAGELHIDFNGKATTNANLATYKPAIVKGLQASEIKSLKHLINAEIYLKLQTMTRGKFKGTTGMQVPADFAFGLSAKHNKKEKKWSYEPHTLKTKAKDNVLLSKSSMGLGYDVEVMQMDIGTAVRVGYDIKLDAESPWFSEKADDEKGWFDAIAEYNKALFTADVSVTSFGDVGAGVMIDTYAGSKVPIEDCRAELRGVVGLITYNYAGARAGPKMVYLGPYSTNHATFTNPIKTLFKWDMFDRFKLKKEEWCGPLSKLKGSIGGEGSRIFITDAENNVLYDVNYIQNWGDSTSTQAGLFQVGATISETDQLWQDLQNFATPTEVVQELTLPTKVPEGLLNLSFEDDSTKYSMDDEGWLFAWKTFNPGITITNDRSRTPGFAIDCEGNCTDDPILLVVQTPDKDYAYLQFKPQFANALTVEATAKMTQDELMMSATTNYVDAKYTWKTSDGKVLITQKPEMLVPSDSDFAITASVEGKVTLIVESFGQVLETEVDVELGELTPVETAVNSMVGYWESDCINTNNGSKVYYLNFSKHSSNQLDIAENLKQAYSSSGCSGQNTITENWEDSDSNMITLSDQDLPDFVGKNKFIVDENGINVSYNRITKAEFPVIDKSPIDTLVGYWKTGCFKENNLNSPIKSSRYYTRYEKISADTIRSPIGIDELFTSSNCSGSPVEVKSYNDSTTHIFSNPRQVNGKWVYDATNLNSGSTVTIISNGTFKAGNDSLFRTTKADFDSVLVQAVPEQTLPGNTGEYVTESGGNDRSALIIPNGGERWFNGNTETVRWMPQYIIGSNVDLYVLHDDPSGLVGNTSQDVGKVINRKNWYKFASNVPNTGSYSLDPAKMSGTGNAYLVLVVSTSDKSKFDISNNRFSLND